MRYSQTCAFTTQLLMSSPGCRGASTSPHLGIRRSSRLRSSSAGSFGGSAVPKASVEGGVAGVEDSHQVPGRRGEAVPVHAQHQPCLLSWCISNTNGMGGDGTDLPASVAQYLLHLAKKGQVKPRASELLAVFIALPSTKSHGSGSRSWRAGRRWARRSY